MNLRIAKKILKAVGTARESAYTGGQILEALRRTDRTYTERRAREFFHAVLVCLGPRGRAEVLAKGAPGMAFDLLMRTPEAEWKYGPSDVLTKAIEETAK